MAIRKDDPERYSLEYMVRLRKNKYTDSFFQGYKPIHADGMENQSQLMVWNRSKAWEAAGFDKLAQEKKKEIEKGTKLRTYEPINRSTSRSKSPKSTKSVKKSPAHKAQPSAESRIFESIA